MCIRDGLSSRIICVTLALGDLIYTTPNCITLSTIIIMKA